MTHVYFTMDGDKRERCFETLAEAKSFVAQWKANPLIKNIRIVR